MPACSRSLSLSSSTQSILLPITFRGFILSLLICSNKETQDISNSRSSNLRGRLSKQEEKKWPSCTNCIYLLAAAIFCILKLDSSFCMNSTLINPAFNKVLFFSHSFSFSLGCEYSQFPAPRRRFSACNGLAKLFLSSLYTLLWAK